MAQLTKVTKRSIEAVLARGLALKDPIFRLENAGGRIVGDIISSSFKGQRDHERQTRIWDALEAEFGPESVRRVGMLLAYTPDEWSLGTEDEPATGKGKRII